MWALAATVLLTSGIGLAWLNRPATEPQYDFAASAIAHVKHEPESFTTIRDADPERFATILANFGADMRAPIGKVRYVKLCPVPEGTGWHIVFETEEGLVTLMLIPGHQPRGRNLFEEKDGMSALVRAAGQGYYVIVAETTRQGGIDRSAAQAAHQLDCAAYAAANRLSNHAVKFSACRTSSSMRQELAG